MQRVCPGSQTPTITGSTSITSFTVVSGDAVFLAGVFGMLNLDQSYGPSVTIQASGQSVVFTSGTTTYVFSPPADSFQATPGASGASTSYSSGWTTVRPISGSSTTDNSFFMGITIPANQLPAGTYDITYTATFSVSEGSVSSILFH